MTKLNGWMVAFSAFLLCVVSATVGHAQTFSVLYNFGAQLNDPFQPYSSGVMAQGRDGNLYSGAGGGVIGIGDLFRATPRGGLTSLYNFANNGDGSYPYSGLTLGTDGIFYGTAYSGGFGNPPYGTVFRMNQNGTLQVLYVFEDGNDGALPISPPVQGLDGNFYGGTCNTCNGIAATGFGTIYKITPSGDFTALYTCDVTDCWNIEGPLVLGTDGNFYGTSTYGGTSEHGTIFKITPKGKFTVLYNFDNIHGEFPVGGLAEGRDGSFYGTTVDGGSFGYGVVFRITRTGRLTVLHNMNGQKDGSAPFAGVVLATDGNLYGANENQGASSSGCPSGCGTLFRITPDGHFSVLYNFDYTTGANPYSTLVQHTNGSIYGMTQVGGTGDVSCGAGSCGVIYSLNIGATPFVSLVFPAGKVGKTAEILGQGFSGATAVLFNGTQASFKVVSDTFLTATVPSGATSGPVTVTTSGGTLTSNRNFYVLP